MSSVSNVLLAEPAAEPADEPEAPTPEEIISKMSPEDLEGLQSLQNLTLSLGIPTTKTILRFLIDSSDQEPADKNQAYAFVETLSPITEIGCMELKYQTPQKTQKVSYMLIDECAKNYDVVAELDKIKKDINPDKWQEVLHNASMIVFYCRIVYAKLVQGNIEQIQKWFRRSAGDRCDDIAVLHVDPTNNTLYCKLLENYPKRVGIHIRD